MARLELSMISVKTFAFIASASVEIPSTRETPTKQLRHRRFKLIKRAALTNFAASLLATALAFTTQAQAGPGNTYRIDIQNEEERTLTEKAYTLFGHAGIPWDPDGLTLNGIQNLASFAQQNAISRIGIVAYNEPQHYRTNQVDLVVRSDGGQHRLHFPEARTFYVGGGLLSRCLCELLRDTINGTDTPTLDIILVTDAIYEWREHVDGHSLQFVTLENLLKESDVFFSYFESQVIGKDQPFCPNQNPLKHKELPKERFTIELYQDGRKLRSFGGGQEKTIRLILKSSTSL